MVNKLIKTLVYNVCLKHVLDNRFTCEEFKNNLEKMASEEITVVSPLSNSLLFSLELKLQYHTKFATSPAKTYIGRNKVYDYQPIQQVTA